MAIDSTLPVRKAILTALKSDASLVELVAPTSIYPQRGPTNPDWPFLRYENYGQSEAFTATCLDGQKLTIRLHVFAKERQVAGLTVETAEDHTCRIIARVSSALDRRRFKIDRGHFHITWIGSYLLPDGDDADAFHGMCAMRITTLTV